MRKKVQQFNLDAFAKRVERVHRVSPFYRRGYFEAAQKLLQLCDDRDIDVVVSSHKRAYFDRHDHVVHLPLYYGPINQVHAWLHEIGHFCTNATLLDARYWPSSVVFGPPKNREKLMMLDSELDAWWNAKLIVKKHNLIIDPHLFRVQQDRSLMTYVKWVWGVGNRKRLKRSL